jgi:hypothetical protein
VASKPRRFAIPVDPIIRPLVAAVGGRSSAVVEVSEDEVRIRFGRLFDATLPRRSIVAVGPGEWTRLGGLGWRIARDRVGVIGARKGLVEIRLRRPQRFSVALIPWTASRIVVSVSDPKGLISALRT